MAEHSEEENLLGTLDEFRDDDLDDDLVAIANDHLGDTDICELAGVESLGEARQLSLVVNTTGANSVLSDLGRRLPALTSLKLSGSSLGSLRDLGSAWPHLDVLYLSRCGLSDLDGLHGLPKVKELYLAFNDVEDLSPFVALEELMVLDLEANKVSDLAQVEFLMHCTELTDLTLAHNPIFAEDSYRKTVCARLPKLQALDEQVVTASDRAAVDGDGFGDRARGMAEQLPETHSGADGGAAADADSSGGARDAGNLDDELRALMRREFQLVMDGVKYAQVEQLSKPLANGGPMLRPGTALSSRPTTAAGSFAARPLSGNSAGSGATAARPRTSWRPAPGHVFVRGPVDAPTTQRAHRSSLGDGAGVNSSPVRSPGQRAARPGLSRSLNAAQQRPGTAARPGTGRRPGSSGSHRPGTSTAGNGSVQGRPPLPSRPQRQSSQTADVGEDHGSHLTMGTQNVFCGTGIRALRAHKLRPTDAESDAGSAAGSVSSEPRTARSDGDLYLRHARRAGSVRSDGASFEAAALAAGTQARPGPAFDPEYSEILQQLKAVKIEEAWEGHDSFADMELGLADGNDAHGQSAEETMRGVHTVARAPSGQGGADILTLDGTAGTDDGTSLAAQQRADGGDSARRQRESTKAFGGRPHQAGANLVAAESR